MIIQPCGFSACKGRAAIEFGEEGLRHEVLAAAGLLLVVTGMNTEWRPAKTWRSRRRRWAQLQSKQRPTAAGLRREGRSSACWAVPAAPRRLPFAARPFAAARERSNSEKATPKSPQENIAAIAAGSSKCTRSADDRQDQQGRGRPLRRHVPMPTIARNNSQPAASIVGR